jgi:spermidine synthase
MSKAEFMTIARTMLAVFPHVTVWRGDFFPERPIVALVGMPTLRPLDPDQLVRHGRSISGNRVSPEAVRALTLPFYAGTLSAARQLIQGGPLNTDDRPRIEYLAPITQRQQRMGAAHWFTSLELMDFFRSLLDAVPPADDPYLSAIDPYEREWVRAGFHYHSAAVYRALGDATRAGEHLRAFEQRVPRQFRQPHQEEPADRVEPWERGS